MNVSVTDLKILKCLLSDARTEITEIAKRVLISTRTATRRIEKMVQHRIIDFRTARDLSSTNLTGYIEFLLTIDVNKATQKVIIERMYSEVQEFLKFMYPSMNGGQSILALFSCSNISTVDSIISKVRSYDGVQDVELFVITKGFYHQEWLLRAINKRLSGTPRTPDCHPKVEVDPAVTKRYR
jgi:DNA-binding Lrp family transcriptional regulator